jgi:hypothetical protein
VSETPAGSQERDGRAAPHHTLDPDRAVAQAGRAPAGPPPSTAVDARRYRWMIGIFGLVLVLVASVYGFVKLGVGGPGVAPGKRLHYFVAPLATGDLNGDANIKPHCNPSAPNPQALNVCGRTPLVLAFFVTGSGTCTRLIDTLQEVARRFPRGAAQFAAVAVKAGRSDTARLVREHHWTIPVAYDRDGAVGDLYGVEICPMLELARPGGAVRQRLIGSRWLSVPALTAQVQALLAR